MSAAPDPGGCSIARQVAAGAAAVLGLTLLLVGAGTAAALHARQVRALDEALLAAAHGRAHPELAGEVEVEHSRSPVEAWLVRADDPRVPAWAARQALASERPLFLDLGPDRAVLLPFEVEDGAGDRHGVAAAAAPRVTLARSVGPFAAAYGLVALAAAALASLGMLRLVRRAFLPLARAREEAARVVGLGQEARLTAGGPIEVRGLLEAINELLARLEAAYQAQARFTAEAAHELRTPVTAMLGELDVALRADRPADELRAALASTREEALRLRRLVEGLTALARLDAGQAEGGRELARAAELAGRALAAEARLLADAGVTVRLVVDADPELEVHLALVEVALANLLRNTARHAPRTVATLRVWQDGEHAVFDLDDAGPGVPAAEREALFDRFARRGEARRRDREGFGLGLPIARDVARRHGGDCVLDASPAGGLRARLTVRARPAGP